MVGELLLNVNWLAKNCGSIITAHLPLFTEHFLLARPFENFQLRKYEYYLRVVSQPPPEQT